MNHKTVSIKTLGCKLNFAESATIEQMLSEEGFVVAKSNELADCYIINTCAVTETAEKKCRQLIHHLQKVNPRAKIALIGCFSALDHAAHQLSADVDLILGSTNKLDIVTSISSLLNNQIIEKEKVTKDDSFFFSSYSIGERTRSFLKIQDGCNYHCSYCTVCIARGKSRSDSIENVLENVKKIVQHGIKEIVLSGVNLGDFRTQKGETFLDLLKALEDTAIDRIRISSIEPNLLTAEIIDLVAQSKKIQPHFHIPLQSGNDKILALMRRRYKRDFFAQKVKEIKEKMPYCCIAADVIVGFPSESKEDFEVTYDFINLLPINMLHVFPYSARPNTDAANMPYQISTDDKNNRTKQLIALSEKKKKEFYLQQQHQCVEILVEHKQENGFLSGFSPNYIRAKIPYQASVINQLIKVELLDIDTDNVYFSKIITQ